jgi:DNA-binding NarL/FixJ family response regulator
VPTAGPSPPVAAGEQVIRVLLADDHPLMLDGIAKALACADDLEVVGRALSGAEALALAARTAPDVVLLDLRMPAMDGFTCIQELKRRSPATRVIALSASEDARDIRSALRLGADAYVVKTVAPLDLPSIVRQVVDGTAFMPFAEDAGVTAGHSEGLTDREIAILRAVASGLSNRAIGLQLWVSEQTIKFHLRNIFRKLGVSSRTEAALYAYEAGLVKTREPT